MRIASVLVVLLCTGSVYGALEQKFVYESECKGVCSQSEWNFEEMLERIQIVGKDKESDIYMEYSAGYNLLSYKEQNATEEGVTVTKEGPCLLINQNIKNKQKMKSHKLGDSPWVQDFKFGFRPFLLGQNKSFLFQIIDIDSLDVHDMVASKDIEESIQIGNHTYNTQKIKITLKGFKKKFWTGYAWFDKKTNQMIKYRANKGPGTSYTEVVLKEAKT